MYLSRCRGHRAWNPNGLTAVPELVFPRLWFMSVNQKSQTAPAPAQSFSWMRWAIKRACWPNWISPRCQGGPESELKTQTLKSVNSLIVLTSLMTWRSWAQIAALSHCLWMLLVHQPHRKGLLSLAPVGQHPNMFLGAAPPRVWILTALTSPLSQLM